MILKTDFPTIEVEPGETFRVKGDRLMLGRWKNQTWFSPSLEIEGFDFRDLLEVLADHLQVKIVEEEIV